MKVKKITDATREVGGGDLLTHFDEEVQTWIEGHWGIEEKEWKQGMQRLQKFVQIFRMMHETKIKTLNMILE